MNRMRIVAVSDLHGYLPVIPACDLLIVAGDVCPDRFGPFLAQHAPEQQKAWFDEWVRPWLADAPAVHKVLTWGNHDWCGQLCSFRNDSPAEALTTDLQILVDEVTQVPASDANAVTVWASPWSNPFMNWAFMKAPERLAAVYAAIPTGIDVLVSHQPPYGYGDLAGANEHLGSRELLAAIERTRPQVVICGHIHSGHGRFTHDGIPIYNVSLVDEHYRLAHAPTVIDLA